MQKKYNETRINIFYNPQQDDSIFWIIYYLKILFILPRTLFINHLAHCLPLIRLAIYKWQVIIEAFYDISHFRKLSCIKRFFHSIKYENFN